MQRVKGHSTFLTNKTDLNLCCWYLWLESQVRWTGVLPLIPANPQDVCVRAWRGRGGIELCGKGWMKSCGYISLHPAFTLFPFSSLSINLGSFFSPPLLPFFLCCASTLPSSSSSPYIIDTENLWIFLFRSLENRWPPRSSPCLSIALVYLSVFVSSPRAGRRLTKLVCGGQTQPLLLCHFSPPPG